MSDFIFNQVRYEELVILERDPIITELVFVNLLRSPGIDSRPGGPVRQPYFSYRSAKLHRLAESNSRNRFLVSLNVYKYGLWTFCVHQLMAAGRGERYYWVGNVGLYA